MPAGRPGIWATISAAVNWETRVMRILPPTRTAMFFTSVPNVGDWKYCLNCDTPA